MSTLGWIISFTLLGGFCSASVAGLFLLLDEKSRSHSMPYLVAFATGALLGAALLGLLPEAIALSGPDHFETVGLSLLGGIALFFILEKLVLWRHCHEDHCETHVPTAHHHDKASASLLLVGDAVHNLLDGVLIAAAFLTDVKLGIVAGFAVMAHEIPSEVGNFAVLLQGGMSRARALFFNLATSLTSVAGGLIGYFALSQARGALPYALGVSAASLLYVAVADLIPGLHRRIDPRSSIKQVLLMTLGVLVIYTVEKLLPHG
ncbi:MAG: ZIP family metal transporter [Pseudomonadota bacterium]